MASSHKSTHELPSSASSASRQQISDTGRQSTVLHSSKLNIDCLLRITITTQRKHQSTLHGPSVHLVTSCIDLLPSDCVDQLARCGETWLVVRDRGIDLNFGLASGVAAHIKSLPTKVHEGPTVVEDSV